MLVQQARHGCDSVGGPCTNSLQALYDFEEVIAMEKKQPSTPREFALVSSLYRVSHYNVACCYAAIDQVRHYSEISPSSLPPPPLPPLLAC